MKSKLNSLVPKDFLKSALNAILVAIGMAILKAIQVPEFSVFTADWGAILNSAINAAISAFIINLGVAFRTDEDGKLNLGGKVKL